MQELSAAELSGHAEAVSEVCRRALNSPTVQSDPDKVFHFGIKLAAVLLAHDEPVSPQEVDEGISVMQKMLELISREDRPNFWARIHLQLGAAFIRRVQGNEKQNIQSAILHYESALLVLRSNHSPSEWALAKVSAGEAYWRLDGDSERIAAIACIEDALTVFTQERFPDEYKDYSEELRFWREKVSKRGQL